MLSRIPSPSLGDSEQMLYCKLTFPSPHLSHDQQPSSPLVLQQSLTESGSFSSQSGLQGQQSANLLGLNIPSVLVRSQNTAMLRKNGVTGGGVRDGGDGSTDQVLVEQA